MNETVLTIVFVLAVTVIFSYFSFRQKKSSWTGELVDKKYIKADSDDDSYTPEKHILVFKTESGKRVKVTVSKDTYNDYHIGNKAEKISGKFHIQKLN